MARKQGWIPQILTSQKSIYRIYISERDETGFRALSKLKDRGVNLVANALTQSTDHILEFFTMLRTELSFYVACLRLHDRLVLKGEPVSFSLPLAAGEHRHSFTGLYDVCLSVSLEQRTVGNNMNANQKDLVIITGTIKAANPHFYAA